MGDLVTYPCKRCKSQIPFKEVHYANNGRDVLCTNCFEATVKKQIAKEKPLDVQKTISGRVAKEKYLCVKCRYNFTYAKSEAALRCPFCGHAEVLKDNYNAEKLLQEAMEMQ